MNSTGRYRIVPTKLQRDPAWRGLDVTARYVALTIFANRQLGRVPVSLFSLRAAAGDAMLPDHEYAEAFRGVVQAFGWAYDEDAEHLYIPDWFTFNQPQNPSHLQAVLRDLDELAPSPLIDRFAVEAVATLATSGLQRAFSEGMATRGLPRGGARVGAPDTTRAGHQEQEQEHELELEHTWAAESAPRRVDAELVSTSISKATRSGDNGNDADLLARFDAFWSLYPKKIGKDAAKVAWRKRKPNADLMQKICAALEWQRHQDSWLKDGGQFVPHPATWINRGQWEDEPPTTPRLSGRNAVLAQATEGFLNAAGGDK